MRSAKLGIVASLIVLTGVGLLWVTEAVPRADLREATPKAIGAIIILVIAGLVWSAMRGSAAPDDTDKRAP